MPPSEQARWPAEGESKWFTEEVKPFEPALRAYLLRRFPSLPDHDDLIQETYIRLLRARGQGRHNFARALLFTVARNVAIDMFRRRRLVPHEPICDVSAMPLLEEAPDVAEALEAQQRRVSLIAALASLPERCRQVMLLRHLDGHSYREIADRLGIGPCCVSVLRLRRMRVSMSETNSVGGWRWE